MDVHGRYPTGGSGHIGIISLVLFDTVGRTRLIASWIYGYDSEAARHSCMHCGASVFVTVTRPTFGASWKEHGQDILPGSGFQ